MFAFILAKQTTSKGIKEGEQKMKVTEVKALTVNLMSKLVVRYLEKTKKRKEL